MKKTIVTLFLALLFPTLAAMAYNDTNIATVNNLRKQLSKVKTPKDSLRILYDIFDLASRQEYRDLAREMYGVAKRAGDVDAQLDIIRQISSVLNKEEWYNDVLEELKHVPISDEQKETVLFIKMKQVSIKARNLQEEERQKEITSLIAELSSAKELDKYDRMLLLFKVVEYLRNDTSGEILSQYIDMLVRMSESEDFRLYVLPNLIYSEATNVYTSAGDHKKAVKADRKLLEVIAGLEKKYADMGRKYRNYDVNKFICYRRMLRNFEGLGPNEANELYSKIMDLRKSNWDVAKDIESNPYTYAYYYMSMGAYAQAIPYLKLLLESDKSIASRKQVLEYLIKAADKTGDRQTALQAQAQYDRIKDEYERLNAAENYKMLQIKYDVKALEERNTLLELENREKDLKTARAIMWVVIAAFIILAITLALLLYYWSRHRKNIGKLSAIAGEMTRERILLRNRVLFDFGQKDRKEIENKDYQSELLKQAKESKSDISTFMIQTIINDLLHIALMGKEDRDLKSRDMTFDNVIRRAEHLAMERNDGKHNFSVTYPEDDFKIETDKESLAIALGHIMNFIALNSEPGSTITLDFKKIPGKLEFIFTTGSQFRVTDSDAVFDTMFTIDEVVKMSAGGMGINRLIALLLESEIIHDKTYPNGTRLVFTTPDRENSL